MSTFKKNREYEKISGWMAISAVRTMTGRLNENYF